MSAPTAAAADRQLSPPPPHWSLQPPVGPSPPPIDRLSPPPPRWSLQPPVGPPPPPIDSYRRRRHTGPSSCRWGRRRCRTGPSSRRWGRRRRQSTAYRRRRRAGPSSRRRSGIGWSAYLMLALSTLRPVHNLMSCVMLKTQTLALHQ
jgi:hypothetical protein